MSDKAHDSVGTGILPVLYGQARRLSHQSVAELGMSSPDTNRTKLLATAIKHIGQDGSTIASISRSLRLDLANLST
jgi:hypothetical protein